MLAVALVGGATAAAVVLRPRHETLASAASTLAPSASPGKASESATDTAVSEQQAATSVAGMLARSGSDRTAIVNAVGDVSGCGPNLAADPAVFEQAAGSRQSLLGSLASLPGRGLLPAALVTDLTDAWQASIAADDDFARWADDEIAKGCVANDTSDPGYQAATTPDNEATAAKQAFVAQWNPLAARYGLTQYQWDQL